MKTSGTILVSTVVSFALLICELVACATITSASEPSQQKVLRPTESVHSALTIANAKPYVTTVDSESPSANAGIRVGDLIMAINGQPAPSVEIVFSLMDKLGRGPATFTVSRDGTELEIAVVPAATKPRFGVSFAEVRKGIYSLPDSDEYGGNTDKFTFVIALHETTQGVLLAWVSIVNDMLAESLTVGPDSFSLKAYGVPLKRLSPEETVNILYGPEMATLGVPMEQGTYVSQSVAIPSPPQPDRPPGYEIDSRTTTVGNTRYGRATIREMPTASSGSAAGAVLQGLAQGLQEGLQVRRASEAARQEAEARALPHVLQEQRRRSREELLRVYTGDLTFFQRQELRTVSVPAGGSVSGVLIYDNARYARPLEFVIDIAGSRRIIEFSD